MVFTYHIQPGGPAAAGGAKADPKGHTVTVAPLADGRFRVRIDDGEDALIDARRLSPSTWSLLPAEGGRQALIDVEGTLPDLKVAALGGEPVALKLLDARAHVAETAAVAGPAGPASIRAPMPGKVVKVLCQVGQEVKAGTGLLIIEAMKMENELRAPGDGVVKEIAAAEGQSVEGGAVVIVIG